MHDILPLLAYLKGFPLADDLPGRLPEEVFAETWRRGQPVKRIATYGKRGYVTASQSPDSVEQEMMDQLRALGYIE